MKLRTALAFALCVAFAAPALAQNSLSQQPGTVAAPGDGNHIGTAPNGDGESRTQAEPAPSPATDAPPARPTLSGEGIADFDSDETLGTDGALHVRETLTVNVTGSSIRHGIFRDFPTDYKDRHGLNVRVGFSVESVTRDGQPEPYDIYSISNGKEVKIGSADSIVEPGTHTYVIVYTTTRQIGFFDGYDELYWNATGNGWRFPIAHARATVHLPPGASIIQSAFFTGAQGETGQDGIETRADARTISWETTRILYPGDGLTIAVGFTKGVVAAPTWWGIARDYLTDNSEIGVAVIGLFALFAYFGIVWVMVGRDPSRGTVVPLFDPPKDISAAAARFIWRMGYDRKAFAAALIAMASKGFITIKEESGSYRLTLTGKTEIEAGLAGTERAVAKALFAGKSSVALQQSSHDKVQNAISALQTALRTEDEGVYFASNAKWWWWGIAIIVVTIVACAIFSSSIVTILPLIVPVGAWAIGASLLVHAAYKSWTNVIHGPGFKIWSLVGALIWTVFAFLVGGVMGFWIVTLSQDVFPVTATIVLVLQGVLAFIFYRLLKAPTVAGQKIRDQIEGLRLYLTTAETQRFEMLHPPKVTPEVFEKLLPYAIALDCENAWSKKFEAEAAAAGFDPARASPAYATYTPSWYSGSSFSRLGTAAFAASVGGAIGTAAASAAVAPGTSSGSYHSSGGFSSGGFSGGGFSGGGGGGGGGGGW